MVPENNSSNEPQARSESCRKPEDPLKKLLIDGQVCPSFYCFLMTSRGVGCANFFFFFLKESFTSGWGVGRRRRGQNKKLGRETTGVCTREKGTERGSWARLERFEMPRPGIRNRFGVGKSRKVVTGSVAQKCSENSPTCL